jgi:hypothetical protein
VFCLCLELYPQGNLWADVSTKDWRNFRISNFRFSNNATEIRGHLVDLAGNNTTSMSVKLDKIQEISFANFHGQNWNFYKWCVTIYLKDRKGFFDFRPSNLRGVKIIGNTDIGSLDIPIDKVRHIRFFQN